MKKNILYLLLCVLTVGILSGCGASTEGKSKSADRADFTLEKSENLDSLRQKYPDWFDENGNISYPYSVESKEYQEAKSFEEQTELMQIPKEVVDAIDTVQLLDAVERYPILSFSLYDTFEIALETYTSVFYGMEALLEREDGYKAAYLKFSERSKKEIKKIDLDIDGKYWEGQNDLGRIRLEEYLMLSEQAFDAMTEEQRDAVMEVLVDRQDVVTEKEEEVPPMEHILEQCLKENQFWLPYSNNVD